VRRGQARLCHRQLRHWTVQSPLCRCTSRIPVSQGSMRLEQRYKKRRRLVALRRGGRGLRPYRSVLGTRLLRQLWSRARSPRKVRRKAGTKGSNEVDLPLQRVHGSKVDCSRRSWTAYRPAPSECWEIDAAWASPLKTVDSQGAAGL
jgi:hypothetical protein